MSAVEKYLKESRERHMELLLDWLRIPSISTLEEHRGDVRRAGEWAKEKLLEAGCTKAEVFEHPENSFVYAEWMGAPGKPTLLVYGHFDVQPVDPLDLWDSPPFEPVIRDGLLYARGATDDKGQALAYPLALEAYLATEGTCPVNLKFLLEGGEENGSPGLAEFIAEHKELLSCDVVAISDTEMLDKKTPSISHALRGLCYLQIDVVGTNTDLHSGTYGGAVINPANALAQILAQLKDQNGKIKVPGFYDKVRPLTAAERKALAALPHSDAKYKKSIGAPELFGEKGYTTLERTGARPTLDINGIWSGFTGVGAKTVLPKEAHAKFSMRLVPDQDPKDIAKKVSAYVKKIAPKSVKVTVTDLHGGFPFITDIDNPALVAASTAVKRAMKKAPLFAREGGSIPIVVDISRNLGAPVVLLGFGLPGNNAHAPNENHDVDFFYKGIETVVYLFDELGKTDLTSKPAAKKPAPKKPAAKKPAKKAAAKPATKKPTKKPAKK